MNAPQVIFIALTAVALGAALAKDGELKTGSSARWNFVHALIGNGLLVAILWWGGFFSHGCAP